MTDIVAEFRVCDTGSHAIEPESIKAKAWKWHPCLLVIWKYLLWKWSSEEYISSVSLILHTFWSFSKLQSHVNDWWKRWLISERAHHSDHDREPWDRQPEEETRGRQDEAGNRDKGDWFSFYPTLPNKSNTSWLSKWAPCSDWLVRW